MRQASSVPSPLREEKGMEQQDQSGSRALGGGVSGEGQNARFAKCSAVGHAGPRRGGEGHTGACGHLAWGPAAGRAVSPGVGRGGPMTLT